MSRATEVIVGIALDEGLTLEQLARACAVEPDWIVARVTEGLFVAEGRSAPEWRFTATTLRRARRMRAIERDFDAAPELAALVADMLDEMDSLRARLGAGGYR